MDVPFLDLKAQYISIRPSIDSAIAAVLDSTAFVRGPCVSGFEKEFSEAHGGRPCVSVANGTDALFVSYHALGIGPGDEVITSASSWIATSETISLTGATPVFVDVDCDYFHLNAALIESKITERTRAIVPVHLYGQPVEMDAVLSLCRKYNLFLIEDCAQAHFAEYAGQRVGTFGEAASFSFYPGKNLGAYGDAGCILVKDNALATKCRRFANHGSSLAKHEHEEEGINSRLDGLQAAVLSAKLPFLKEWNAKRALLAGHYSEKLADVDQVITPKVRPGATHVFHVYCIRAKRRAELQAWLQKKGIQTAIHYPKALPFLKAYERFGARPENFPVAYQLQEEILSLPIYPEMAGSSVDYVVSGIKDFYARG